MLTLTTTTRTHIANTYQLLTFRCRGTQVAVKQVLPPSMTRPKSSVAFTPPKDHFLSGRFDDPEQGIIVNSNSVSSSNKLDADILTRAARRGFLGPHTAALSAVPSFDLKQWHRHKSEFMQEMMLLSKLRHPCITTVMGKQPFERRRSTTMSTLVSHY